MSWTKRQLINQAYEEAGLSSYVFTFSADQYQSAARKLDSMVATWDSKGIKFGYPISGDITAIGLDTDTNIPDTAAEAVYLNLGLRLASGIGRQVSQELKASAKDAYDALIRRAAFPPEMQFPGTMPAGAGNKDRGVNNPFMPATSEKLTEGTGSELIF